MKAFAAFNTKIRKTDVGSFMGQIPPDGIHVRIVIGDIRNHDGFTIGVCVIVTDCDFDTEFFTIGCGHDW
ncbi:hypothetical protein [Photorhabdus sp. RM96S]|uniref:hypothetical protein n=1 Tax=Photorhabdus sp. RM96S TaxID=3342822 RepID=UPI0036D8B3E7